MSNDVNDGEKSTCTDFGNLVYYYIQALANDI
jgi:hypothetical protein